jgi:hypothetical protein
MGEKVDKFPPSTFAATPRPKRLTSDKLVNKVKYLESQTAFEYFLFNLFSHLKRKTLEMR